MSFSSPTDGWVGTITRKQRMWRTQDGKTWADMTPGLPAEPSYDLVYRHGLDVDATGERLVMGSTTGVAWVSEDGGDSWQALPARLPPVYAMRFV